MTDLENALVPNVESIKTKKNFIALFFEKHLSFFGEKGLTYLINWTPFISTVICLGFIYLNGMPLKMVFVDVDLTLGNEPGNHIDSL